jgi:hypothetical protein
LEWDLGLTEQHKEWRKQDFSQLPFLLCLVQMQGLHLYCETAPSLPIGLSWAALLPMFCKVSRVLMALRSVRPSWIKKTISSLRLLQFNYSKSKMITGQDSIPVVDKMWAFLPVY